jgi:hypothetical protein
MTDKDAIKIMEKNFPELLGAFADEPYDITPEHIIKALLDMKQLCEERHDKLWAKYYTENEQSLQRKNAKLKAENEKLKKERENV